jgi:hypothetical protein
MSKPAEPASKSTKGVDFWKFFKRGPINTVSLVPPLIACLLVVTWIVAKEKFFPTVPQFYNYAIIFIAVILTGSVGLIYIYRKEMPGPVSSVTIRGGCAVATGYLLLIFFWILGILGFIFALLESY